MRPQLKRWQVYRMHKGQLVQCGQVAAASHPHALRMARQKWSKFADASKPGFGFVVKPSAY